MDSQISTYAAAGVNIDSATAAIKAIKPIVEATCKGRPVIHGIGPFAGAVDIGKVVQGLEYPTLYLATSFGPEKRESAYAAGEGLFRGAVSLSSLGVNPICAVDYYATGQLDRQAAQKFYNCVVGMCSYLSSPGRGIALVGGELAEMGETYRPRKVELIGFLLGVGPVLEPDVMVRELISVDLKDILAEYSEPSATITTDGVGTKVMVKGSERVVGYDIVHHCASDIACSGARPLLFTGIIATPGEDGRIASVELGIKNACKLAGCACRVVLEQRPQIYQPRQMDVVGCMVGVVDKSKLLDGSRIVPGDAIIGFGVDHAMTNGWTMIRRWMEKTGKTPPLKPHPYIGVFFQQLRELGIDIKGVAHITGGGLIDNPHRCLPKGCQAVIEWGSWPVPAFFTQVRDDMGMPELESRRTFNCGFCCLVVVSPGEAIRAVEALPNCYYAGEVRAGERKTVHPDLGE